MNRNSARRTLAAAAALLILTALTGCKPDNIFLTLKNDSGGALKDVKLTYPDNELTTGTLDENSILGAYRHFDGPGNLVISYSTQEGRHFSSAGPAVTGNEKGEVDVIIEGSSAHFETKFADSQR